MIDPFIGLLLLALIGGGFLILRRLLDRRNRMNPPMGMPWQQEYGPKDEYGRSFDPNQSYDPAGYGRPMYGPAYPPQMGMSPWAAGGLGAFGGGFLGYELGRMAGEHEQHAQEGDLMNPDQTATLDQGNYDPGMADSIGPFDAGGFADFGGDFGGGDFGGGSEL